MNIFKIFKSLKNGLFARLYIANTINLAGDALTWVGLALLAFDLGGEKAAAILAFALTLRVLAFVVFAPFAGVLADRANRKKVLVTTHFIRMVLVGLLPFVTELWQLYTLVFLLNVMYAFFSPTYRATIPFVVPDREEYPKAISLSSATGQLLGVLGPGIAGALAIWFGLRELFFLDAATFLVAGVIILLLPSSLNALQGGPAHKYLRTWDDIKSGTAYLFRDKTLLFGLLMQLVSSVVGAMILVNTVVYVKEGLGLDDSHYGWVMAAFGLGATVAALISGILKTVRQRIVSATIGAFIISVAVVPANYLPLTALIVVWFIAGNGESLINIPYQTIIADRVPKVQHGKVYGAQFAWSHLWWLLAYPLAGWLATVYQKTYFLIGSIVAFVLWLLFVTILRSVLHRT